MTKPINMDNLTNYDNKIKEYVNTGLASKANSAHSHGAVQIGETDEKRFTTTTDINRLKGLRKCLELGEISGSNTVDANSYDTCSATLVGATTFVLNATGSRGIKFVIKNPSIGITWPSTLKWVGGAAPTYTIDGTDIIDLYTVDGGTTWYASILQNFN